LLPEPGLSDEQRRQLEDEARELIAQSAPPFGTEALAEEALVRLKEIFQLLRPRVPSELAAYLAEEQANRAPDGRLFTDPEMDLAVWAHAHAYGWGDQATDPAPAVERDHLSELPEPVRSCANLIAPLVPPALDWGATSHLQDEVVAALDSPIMHAWLYQDETDTVTQAVIVGGGIPEVHQEVTAAALSCFFALEPKLEDFALNGLIRLAAAETAEATPEPGEPAATALLRGIGIGFGSDAGAQAQLTMPQSAREAMALLQGALQRLEKNTGLVRTHLVPDQDRRAFESTLRRYNQRAGSGQDAYVWSAEAEQSADTEDVVTVLNFARLPFFHGVVGLALHYDLLENELYRELADRCHHALITDILEDTRRRKEFYSRLLEKHEAQHKWYQELSEEEKRDIEDVWVSHQVDFETGVLIRLAEPERVPGAVFYMINVPHMMEESRNL